MKIFALTEQIRQFTKQHGRITHVNSDKLTGPRTHEKETCHMSHAEENQKTRLQRLQQYFNPRFATRSVIKPRKGHRPGGYS